MIFNKINFFTLAILATFSFGVFGQEPIDQIEIPGADVYSDNRDTLCSLSRDSSAVRCGNPNCSIHKIYDFADERPQFAGGDDSLVHFIKQNYNYPNQACYQGMIYIEFVVEKDGSLTQLLIRKGISHELDEQAIRVVKIMPKWIPGKVYGRIVRTRFMLPIKISV